METLILLALIPFAIAGIIILAQLLLILLGIVYVAFVGYVAIIMSPLFILGALINPIMKSKTLNYFSRFTISVVVVIFVTVLFGIGVAAFSH